MDKTSISSMEKLSKFAISNITQYLKLSQAFQVRQVSKKFDEAVKIGIDLLQIESQDIVDRCMNAIETQYNEKQLEEIQNKKLVIRDLKQTIQSRILKEMKEDTSSIQQLGDLKLFKKYDMEKPLKIIFEHLNTIIQSDIIENFKKRNFTALTQHENRIFYEEFLDRLEYNYDLKIQYLKIGNSSKKICLRLQMHINKFIEKQTETDLTQFKREIQFGKFVLEIVDRVFKMLNKIIELKRISMLYQITERSDYQKRNIKDIKLLRCNLQLFQRIKNIEESDSLKEEVE
ncbi:UNKNOWN [Stylonychia lemnae]|uniref:F-box domain-containing protein n=1 Tax=Stylonychia lemnae TaxID=5949 RepID=A0A078AWY5_STYLE|nr:UNKNOWN [Stylonychia lemnae]|eukprot:CDW86571.1 UNKNOWN [Stylonychia lemnae]